MRLIDLTEDATISTAGHDRIEVAGLTADSRAVRPGFVFAALPGSRHDGRAFVPDAVGAGAVAVLGLPDTPVPAGIPLIADPNPRRRLALMAARFHVRQPETVAAVTGTNGKTSVANFTRQIWAALGHPAAALGTLGLIAPGHAPGASLTTPDPVALHATLADLAHDGIEHAALEASSHGLDQSRLDGVRLRAGAFTNLTRDHLDYHGSMDSYRAAKLRLFDTLLAPGAAAVFNAETPEAETIARIAARRGLRPISYGLDKGDIRCIARAATDTGWRLHLSVLGEAFRLTLPLPGEFQIANALAALGLAIGCGETPGRVAPLLAGLTGVPGRLEHAGRTAAGAPIYIDYAHTPDALATVLKALRPHAAARLTVVFGCGGDRDRGKRPEMGAIASAMADRVIVTDDNPRSEDPAAIRREIMAAAPAATEIGDRRQAIHAAVATLADGDLLVIAGKGHETGQIVGETVLPFSDLAVARDAIAATGGRA
ncbi:MAG: UDP-N-acetylmuramoyl-L-alanyl-D-glutamate--2,6-diaminopimelate ligase [Alphaproteobacteria bacterium]